MDKSDLSYIFTLAIPILGFGIGFLQLYIVTNFNNSRRSLEQAVRDLSKRIDENRDEIKELWAYARDCVAKCQDHRKDLKNELRNDFEDH